ncbi:MAG: cobalamin-binding protein [Smithellaceae bacterium]|nr:cobalamin-binding protein [Smithellaceae bacterium]
MSFNEARLKNRMPLLFLTGVWAVYCLIPSFASAVTDETGRRVQVRPVPQRIVSLAPGISETLYALGLEDRIVGVTTFCDWPPAVQAKTKIGGFTNPSIEKIVSLRPDLILATADGNRKETVRQLEKLGLPVYVTNPTSTSGVLKSIGHIGAITGREKEAAALVEKLRQKLRSVAVRTRGKKKPHVFFQLGMEPMITAGGGTLIHEVIERAGGVNVAGNDVANYPRYSAEGIISASPDIIVFAPMVNDKTFEAVYKFWRAFGEVPAVKNGKIYPIDANLINRASPRIFDAVEILSFRFHPEPKH